jgi:glycosyltransferase involved in cell wall biosynthesis
MPLQRLNSVLFGGLGKADLILVAGGNRTRQSVLVGGGRPERMVECIDYGIGDDLLSRPRIAHSGENLRFVHFGRLVFHKCTFLIIESLAKTKHRICLDVIGRGPELQRCQQRARALGVDDRVSFRDWHPTHAALMDSLKEYRGMVFPSIEDANGIVVQEAMALGLPAICLDWGGPQLLVQHGITGFLIKPTTRDDITSRIAEFMDTLALDGALAERMSIASRDAAARWRWSAAMVQWMQSYAEALSRRKCCAEGVK